MTPNKLKIILAVALIDLIVVLDQASKWAVMHFIPPMGRHVEVAPFLNVVFLLNRGVSFGILSGHASDFLPAILSAVMLVIITVLIILLAKSTSRLRIISLSLIIGGAIGNLIDRIRFGAVVDFIDVHANGYHWPSFNIADSAVVVGVGLLLLHTLLEGK